ncbi:MAG: hemerythrin domain-containing protein [Patescibacteria group bacterium]|nr:hemerythrin domain-containing protein [Patescibacteria group bacterium]
MKATQVLIEEHNAVLTVFEILRKINEQIEKDEKINVDHLDEIVEFFQVFIDQCHHSKEEVDLFPMVESFGFEADSDLVKELLEEHQEGREIVREIKDDLNKYKNGGKEKIKGVKENAEKYIGLLTEHIKKENTILFPRVNNLLSNDDQKEMTSEFEEIEKDVIGLGRHEEFHFMIDELKKIYL